MDLIEAYYAVAEDLEKQGREAMNTSKWLASIADTMSEIRMREKSDAPSIIATPTSLNKEGCHDG